MKLRNAYFYKFIVKSELLETGTSTHQAVLILYLQYIAVKFQ